KRAGGRRCRVFDRGMITAMQFRKDIERDLADALDAGKVRGAALDVFDVEPIVDDHRLKGRANVILTPHIAAQAADNFGKTVSRMFANIKAVSEGREPPALDTLV
ncbi:MAG: NAD(P)-dependent oxidoreductase, partial [Pseudomonadota bacterium]